jgi:hypothetical protein
MASSSFHFEVDLWILIMKLPLQRPITRFILVFSGNFAIKPPQLKNLKYGKIQENVGVINRQGLQ